MADPDPNTPQVVDPELTVNLTRLLQIRGPLGLLNVLDTIVPVVNMGDVVTRTVTVLQPAFRSTDIFSAGVQTAAPLGTVHADTGPLPEGSYDLQIHIAPSGTTGLQWDIAHRNAANTADLAIWHTLIHVAGIPFNQILGYELSLNERIRILNPLTSFAALEASYASIFARRRT